jgi:hypothetical protein
VWRDKNFKVHIEIKYEYFSEQYSIIVVPFYQVTRNFTETLKISYAGDIEEIKVKKLL